MGKYLTKIGLTKYTTKLKEYISKAKVASAASADNATKVNNHTVNSDVPANAKFTDTDTWRPQPDWNATSGDAVIKNKPTSMPASDVPSWAKQKTKPTYTASEIGLGNVGNFKAVSTVANQGLSDTEKINARANIGAQVAGSYASASHTHDDRYYTETEINTKLNNKLNTSLKGAVNGLAELDANGKVPSSQLPSYVDDVVEGYFNNGKFYKESAHTTQITGETGKIYIDLSTEKTYRWSGSAFVVISETLALGETSSTAYRGDRGKIAYDHSQSTHARTDATKVEKSSTNGNIKINGTETTVYTHPSGTNPHGTTKSDVGLGNVGNFKAVSTIANQGLTDTEKSNARANIGAGTSSFSGSYNDLSNKPTIPSVGNGTVTIKQAGTSKGTFTMNQSGNTIIELTDNNTTYGVATSSALGLVKSGTDITVDSSGNVSVNDDSHNHVISNVDGLQSALDGKAASNHTHSSYVNQNAFSNITVGSTTVSADSATDTLTLVAGSNVTITPDATNDKITISATDTNTWRPLGTTADTACAGNDSRLSNARPASDVYAWAKASSKPSYSKSEVGLGKVDNTADADKSVKYAATAGSANSVAWSNVSGKPTIPSVGNGTVTITQNGVNKGSFTMNQSGNTTIALTDNNTWRGIQNNLTSDSTTDSLSAAQGKVLKGLVDGKAASSHTHNYLPLSGGVIKNNFGDSTINPGQLVIHNDDGTVSINGRGISDSGPDCWHTLKGLLQVGQIETIDGSPIIDVDSGTTAEGHVWSAVILRDGYNRSAYCIMNIRMKLQLGGLWMTLPFNFANSDYNVTVSRQFDSYCGTVPQNIASLTQYVSRTPNNFSINTNANGDTMYNAYNYGEADDAFFVTVTGEVPY